MRRSRPLVVLLAIVSVVALAAMLPAQTQGWAEWHRWYLPGTYTTDAAIGGQDLDGDGFGDLLLGASGLSQFPLGLEGGFRAFSGRTGRAFGAVSGARVSGRLGSHLAWIPDVDGDQRTDFLVGGSGVSIFTNLAPAVIQVRSTMTGGLLRELRSPDPTLYRVLQGLAGVRDLDGDGRGDVIALYQWLGCVAAYSGRTGALLWRRDIPGAPMAMIAGRDLDLDGIEDVVVGGAILAGGAWGVVACSGSGGRQLWLTPAPSPQSRFGTQLAWLDDLDGDGSAEVAVGAPDAYLSGVPPLPGSVQVLSGADGSARSALVGAVPEFGRTLAAPGDLDGDGSIDLLVTDGSKTDLYSGTTGRILASFFPPAHYLSGVGDLDGDGRSEWVSRGWSGWTSVYGWR